MLTETELLWVILALAPTLMMLVLAYGLWITRDLNSNKENHEGS